MRGIFLILTKDLDEKLIEYCEELEVIKNLSDKTVQNYYMANKIFIAYLKKNKINNLSDVNNTLKKFIIYLKKERKIKYASINKYLEQILLFLSYLDLNISIELPRDNSRKKKIKYLKIEEIQSVIETIPDSYIRDKTIIQTLFRTGLRVSELANLKKYNLDLNSHDEVVAIDIEDGKGGKDRRVYIDQDTLQLINKMIYNRTRKNRKDKNDFLFTSKTGEGISIRAIENLVKKWAKKTDEKMKKKNTRSDITNKLTPHTLRHSFTIYLLNKAKRPINEIQQLLGHGSIATTQIYTQVDNEDIKKGYNKIKWADNFE